MPLQVGNNNSHRNNVDTLGLNSDNVNLCVVELFEETHNDENSYTRTLRGNF